MEKFSLRGFKKKKVKVYTLLAIVVLCVLVFILSRATWSVFLKNKETSENLSKTMSDFNNLKEREDVLRKEIQALQTARGLDQEIRNKFRLVKDGEKMIMLLDSPKNIIATSSKKSRNLWSRFFDLF